MVEQNPNPERQQEPTERERWRDRRQRGGMPGLFVGLLLVWLGVCFFLANQGTFSWGNWWQYFLVGLGAIFLIDAVVRYGQTKSGMFVRGRVIAGVVLIAVGLIFILGSLSNWWPLILIVLGLVILLGGLWTRRI